MNRCRSCGAPIRFEKTKNGNFMPCNPKALYYIPDREGDIYVLTESGEVIRAREGTEPGVRVRVGFIPHFATCSAKTKKKRKSTSEKISENAEKIRKMQEAAREAEEARIAKRCAEVQAEYELSQRVKQLSILPDDFYGW